MSSDPIVKKIEAVIEAAMKTGDWSAVDAYRDIFSEESDSLSATLLRRLNIEVEIARTMRAAHKLAAIIEHSGDTELLEDFRVMLESFKTRIQFASKAERSAMASSSGLKNRWRSATNAVRYKSAIDRARMMKAIPSNSRADILDAVRGERSVKGLSRKQLTRILLENKALPPARKLKKNG